MKFWNFQSCENILSEFWKNGATMIGNNDSHENGQKSKLNISADKEHVKGKK